MTEYYTLYLPGSGLARVSKACIDRIIRSDPELREYLDGLDSLAELKRLEKRLNKSSDSGGVKAVVLARFKARLKARVELTLCKPRHGVRLILGKRPPDIAIYLTDDKDFYAL